MNPWNAMESRGAEDVALSLCCRDLLGGQGKVSCTHIVPVVVWLITVHEGNWSRLPKCSREENLGRRLLVLKSNMLP